MIKNNLKDKKIEKPKIKNRYIIEVQGVAPVIVQMETWALDEEEALKQLDNASLINIRNPPKINLSKLLRHKVTIKESLTSLVKLVKIFK